MSRSNDEEALDKLLEKIKNEIKKMPTSFTVSPPPREPETISISRLPEYKSMDVQAKPGNSAEQSLGDWLTQTRPLPHHTVTLTPKQKEILKGIATGGTIRPS